MKIKKGIPLIDQHDKNGFWGGKFGGNFIPETLKKPVEDLTVLFEKSIFIIHYIQTPYRVPRLFYQLIVVPQSLY